MSVKHVKEYYDTMCSQYHELCDGLREFEELCDNNIISPERLENMKKMVEPLRNNYQTLSYIMYLLNMPNRKERQKKYEKMHKKFLGMIDDANTKQGKIDENKKVLKDLKDA